MTTDQLFHLDFTRNNLIPTYVPCNFHATNLLFWSEAYMETAIISNQNQVPSNENY
jgi:hypothetical protein